MTRRRLYFFLWIAAGVAAAIAVTVMVRNEIAILHGPNGDFAGYWLNDQDRLAQRVWSIENEDGQYTIGGLRMGGRRVAQPATLEGAELVVKDSTTGSRWEARLRIEQGGERIAVRVSRNGKLVRQLTLRKLPTPSTPDVDWSAFPSGFAARTIEEGIRALELGIEAYRIDRGSYPPVAAVRPGGTLREFVDGWPVNPTTDKLMKPGATPGDYIYTQGDAGQSYTLAGLLPDGTQFVVP
jgi:hypothetical protein